MPPRHVRATRLGNWGDIATDADGNGTYATAETEERSHNAANEITSLEPAGSGPPPAVPFVYDDNGNIGSRGRRFGFAMQGLRYRRHFGVPNL